MGLFDSNAGVKLRGILKGLLAGISADDENFAMLLAMGAGRPSLEYQKTAADAMAADATTDATAVLGSLHDGAVFPNGSTTRTNRVVRAAVFPGAALTAHDTNYATLTLSSYTAAGGSKTTVASVTTQITGGSGNWVAFAPVAMTLSTVAGATVIPAGGGLSLAIAKAASGVVVPVSRLQVWTIPEA